MHKTHLFVVSGGKKNNTTWCEIKIDGTLKLHNNIAGRGINLIALDKTYHPIKFKTYDFQKHDLTNTFINDIKSILNNSLIILSIKENAHGNMSITFKDFIKTNFKSQYINTIDLHMSWCIVLFKKNELYIKIDEKMNNGSLATINDYYIIDPVTKNIPKHDFDISFLEKSLSKKMTSLLLTELRKNNTLTLRDKMNILKNKYKGQKCYIITCGPSLNDYNPNLIKEFVSDGVVFCIKQAYNIFSDVCDFHLINFCNLEQYKTPKTITCYMHQDELTRYNYDLCFWLNKSVQFNKYHSQKIAPISKTMDFDNYTFDKTLERPEGPGIMYELGIYLAIHLGVSEICCIGWDLTYRMPKMINGKIELLNDSHFYGGNRNTQKNIEKIVSENIFIANSTRYLNAWLKTSYNIPLTIVSNNSNVDQTVPRIDPIKAVENKRTFS